MSTIGTGPVCDPGAVARGQVAGASHAAVPSCAQAAQRARLRMPPSALPHRPLGTGDQMPAGTNLASVGEPTRA
jgi:hypothetical protein